MAQPRMPNFLLIGAQKSGTTSLYHYLRQHPEIYLSPIKEPCFFAVTENGPPVTEEDKNFIAFQSRLFPNDIWTDTLKDYQALFAAVGNEKAIGEASTMYWTSYRAPRCIKHYVPNAQLIAILRDPAERAYSAYRMIKRLGHETLESFDETLSRTDFLDPDSSFKPTEHPRYMRYLVNGHYFSRLNLYLESFARENIRVYLFEEFVDNPMAVLEDMFSFLGVDTTFTPDMGTRHHADRVVSAMNPAVRAFEAVVPARVRTAARALTPPALRYRYDRIRGSQLGPRCPPDARKRLIAYYRDDMVRLQDLIGRDLQSWFAVPSNGDDG